MGEGADNFFTHDKVIRPPVGREVDSVALLLILGRVGAQTRTLDRTFFTTRSVLRSEVPQQPTEEVRCRLKWTCNPT